jgi:hypothetical protein
LETERGGRSRENNLMAMEYFETLHGAFDWEWGLVRLPAYGMGYHTRFKGGEAVHPTRESMEYARMLLERPDSEGWKRAALVISNVLPLQETREDDLYRGVWPWFAEEPVSEMSPPDRNWADFIGAQLCEMLVLHSDKLPSDLVHEMRKSLRLACDHIVARNIGPDYSNICAMGAAVTCIGGELLDDARLRDYALRRMTLLDERVAGYDLFDEFNSPVYTPILIEELDRIVRLSKSNPAKRIATRLKELAMRGAADHLHHGTGQWGGAQARAYRDRLGPAQLEFLQRYQLDKRKGVADDEERTVRASVPGGARLTTWSDDRVTIGSVSRGTFWSQARPVIAYWKADNGRVCVFRVRVMIDGRDFASAEWSSVQRGPSILASIALAPERGVWHAMLDKPKDGIFRCRDLRIRFEVQPDGGTVEVELEDESFCLFSGGYGVRASVGSAVLAGRQAVWEKGESAPETSKDRGDWFPTDDTHGKVTAGSAWVDAVFSDGEQLVFRTEDFRLPEFIAHLSFGAGYEKPSTRSKPRILRNRAHSVVGVNRLTLSLVPLLAAHEMVRSWHDPFWLLHPMAWTERLRARLAFRSRWMALFDAASRRSVRLFRKLITQA